MLRENRCSNEVDCKLMYKFPNGKIRNGSQQNANEGNGDDDYSYNFSMIQILNYVYIVKIVNSIF